MVALGRANSRMKDFCDVWVLTKTFSFDPDRLARTIAATFTRRQTAIPTELPDALSSEFPEDPVKQRQWSAFVSNLDDAPKQVQAVIQDLTALLVNAAAAAGDHAAR